MIKVIIERVIIKGLEANYKDVSQALLGEVLKAEGYLSGESWEDMNSPNHRIIITNWISLQDWKRWEASPERKTATDALLPLLDKPEKITILRSQT